MRFIPISMALAASFCFAGLAAAQTAPPAGDAARGERLYEQRCAACHSLDANRIGPAHRGVFGRRVGAAPGFAYSRALRARSFTWDSANLDRWLTNPTAFVPGTTMGIRVPAAPDRADLIAYLRARSPSATPRRR